MTRTVTACRAKELPALAGVDVAFVAKRSQCARHAGDPVVATEGGCSGAVRTPNAVASERR